MKTMSFKAALLVLLSGTAFAAHAGEPELYFYPAKAWNITASPVVEAASGGKNCTIGNEFNNGFIMELSGSSAGIENLNINFIQPAFEAGETYDVSLTVPGSISKSVTGQAVQGEILSVNVAGQADLYSALRTAGVLDVRLTDNVFRFYMTGFADSMKRFDECVGGAKAPAAPQPEQIKEAAAEAPQEIAPEEEAVPVASIKTEDGRVVVDLTKPPAFDTNAAEQKSTETVSPRVTSHNISEDVYEMPFEAQQMEAGVKAPGSASQKEEINWAQTSEDAKEGIEQAEGSVADEKISSGVSGALNGKKPERGGYKRLSERLAEEMKSLAPPPAPSASAPGMPAPAAPAAVAVESAPPAMKASSQVQAASAAAIAAAKEEKSSDDGIQATYIPEDKSAEKPIEKETINFNQPAPDSAEDNVKSFSSPEMKINRRSTKVETDLTGLSDVEPSSSKDEEPFQSTRFESGKTSDTAMRDKIVELEKMIRELNRENENLEGDLKGALQQSKNEQASVSSENWNLERATMRYNEAERQIERLGQQLQRERATCETESRKLENMLFDPEVTDQKQMERLTTLEREIEAAKAEQDDQRRQYEERIRLLEDQLKTR